MAVKQTAGRTALGEFAPKFAELNDDVLFGQVWSREDKLSLKERSLITVAALLSQGLTDTSFVHHLESVKANGITKSEIAEVITHAAKMPMAGIGVFMMSPAEAQSAVENALKSGVRLIEKIESACRRKVVL